MTSFYAGEPGEIGVLGHVRGPSANQKGPGASGSPHRPPKGMATLAPTHRPSHILCLAALWWLIVHNGTKLSSAQSLLGVGSGGDSALVCSWGERVLQC